MAGRRVINLALQGGGALGALTWGILDRLLQEPWLDFEGLSGSSAGAMNAVALAAGLAAGGREGARQLLESFWTAVGKASYPVQISYRDEHPGEMMPSASKFLLGWTRFFSPYQLNPFDINPLRRIVDELIDFELVRARAPVRLFVGATHVRSGTLRVFEGRSLTAEHLLASACLPAISQAVVIDGDAYWDGGYAGNPAIYPLLYECASADVLIVLLLPLMRDQAPTSADGIRTRITEIHLNSSFLREMRSIGLAQRIVGRASFLRGPLERRLAAARFHMIDTEDLVNRLAVEKSMNTSLQFLLRLRDEGRDRAERWLQAERQAIGRRSSIDIQKLFGDGSPL
ncbi:MAG TPA: patatin-like phospholipase family protein [Burkholderiaceae bacterium]|nr:patatin-like phospholipase family protein [Burkholderiaceae bacterium]